VVKILNRTRETAGHDLTLTDIQIETQVVGNESSLNEITLFAFNFSVMYCYPTSVLSLNSNFKLTVRNILN